MNITIFDIADWFLSQEPMTHKKLQKLCYYAYSWFIYLNNDDINDITNRMFDGKFEAWVHGPVNRDLYNKYKNKGFEEITLSNSLVTLPQSYIDLLNQVWSVYGGYSGDQLESITHQETPWINARRGLASYEATNKLIEEVDMFKEYSKR